VAGSFFLEPPGAFHVIEVGDFESIERIGDGLQMLVRKMQVDEGVLQSGMSEQKLNGTEIGTGFQQVSCATMPQRMRRKVFGDAGGSGGVLTGQPNHIGGDGYVGAPALYRTREQISLRFHPAPVDTQGGQQLGAQRNIDPCLAEYESSYAGCRCRGPLNGTVRNAAWQWSYRVMRRVR
jgi:hypothetical protein